jgi:hypothetical protein
MAVIGVAHKRTHTVVAVDEAGRKLAERMAAATGEGHLEAVSWRTPTRRLLRVAERNLQVRSAARPATYCAPMTDQSQTVRIIGPTESISTFEWHSLHLHVVTREPLSADQARTIQRVLPKVASVGHFAEVVGTVLGRSVRIRTERPSPDIRLEVGR